jgi:AraC-like DNA-binding protein
LFKLIIFKTQVFLIVCFAAIQASGQADARTSAFDSLRHVIAFDISNRNMNTALQMANSLLLNSVSNQERVTSLLLIATLYNRSGNRVDAIKYAVEGERIAERSNLRAQQMRAAGLLSTTFRYSGLTTEAKKYLDIVQEGNNVVKDPEIQMMIHQEKAYVALEKQSYEEVIRETKKAINILATMEPKQNDFISHGINCLLLGSAYIRRKDYVQAELHLTEADSLLRHYNTELKGFIHLELGDLYLKTDKNVAGKRHLDTALLYTINSNNFNLKFDVYNSLYDYYERVGDKEQMLVYKKYCADIREQIIQNSAAISNALIEQYDNDLHKEQKSNFFLIGLSSILFVSIIYIIWLFRRYSRVQRGIYLDYLSRINGDRQNRVESLLLNGGDHDISFPKNIVLTLSKESSADPVINADEKIVLIDQEDSALPRDPDTGFENKDGPGQNSFLLPETEERILKGLDRLEKKKVYLKSDITLGYLSSRLKVNTKYASFVINKYKRKDFNNYINELRIEYIVQKLQNESEYLDYKISYLARECGFSSHSKFATIFKSITGISPSSFIKNIRKDKGV